MLATLQPEYPDRFIPIRTAILSHPGLTAHECQQLAACRFNSGCALAVCPNCIRRRGFTQKLSLLKIAAQIPANRLKFVTFTAKDVALSALRSAAKVLVKAGRDTFRQLSTRGYALGLEISREPWSNGHHAHLHALVDSAPAGRRHISADACQKMWIATLPGQLHPIEGGCHIKPVRDLARAANYITEGPFAKFATVPTEEQIGHVVDAILATRGSQLQKFTRRGTLAAAA